jgi:hypothetical protein
MESSGGGRMDINSPLNNSGTLKTNGGTLIAHNTVTGGTATIAGGTLEFVASSSANTTFTASGTLRLDASSSYTGTVSGFTAGDTFDLTDINFAIVQTPVFSGDATGGTLTVTDGSHTAKIALLGNYLASTFVASNDGHSGTFITDPPAAASSQSATAASSITISGTSQVQISDASNENVTFAPGATGELVLGDSAAFTGSITGFTGTGDGNPATSDKLDLTSINFSSANASYANNILTVTDGTHTAQINFIGDYTLANFHFFSDDSGGTLVTDPPVAVVQGTGQSANGTSSGAGSDQTKEKPPATDGDPADKGSLTSGSNGMAVPDIAFSGIDLGQAATLANWPTTHDSGGSVGASASLQDRTIALLGQYMASSFATANEGHGDTPLADPSPDQQQHLSFPHTT